MRIWLIEDNDDAAETILELLADLVPDARIRRFESLREIRDESAGPDLAFIDVSAVCPTFQHYIMGEFLWPFASRYPGTSLAIVSSLAGHVRESIEAEFADRQLSNPITYISMRLDCLDLIKSALIQAGATLPGK
jgi:hypothetical protein